MKTHLKSFIVGFSGALVAAAILWLGMTAYTDHKLVGQLVGLEIQRQQATQQRPIAQPQPAPTPPSK